MVKAKTKQDPVTVPTQEKMRDSIRVAKFEIDTVEGADWKETMARWFTTMEMCRNAANLYYETWLVWHVQNQSREKIQTWLTQRKEIGIKEAGKCPVDCMPNELAKEIYNGIASKYPSLQINVVTLLMNCLLKTLSSGKAAKGSLPKWSSILLHNEAMPSFTRDYPIPFSPVNATLITEGDQRYVELKTWRMPVEGKKANVAIRDRIKLRMTGKSCKGHLTKFDKIAIGEWAFKGSELCWDKNRRKWFVNLCHQIPSRVESLDQSKVAYLVAGRVIPFYIRTIDGKRQWLQGRGNHITAMRERVWSKRVELNYGNKKTTSMQSGHGRDAAMRWRGRWSKTWTHFVKRVNHHVSKDAVDFCVTHGIGKLIYCKPNGIYAERRMVSGKYKNSTWEFFDIANKLSYKCQDRGVELKVVEFGAERASGEVPAKKPGPLAKTKTKGAIEVKLTPQPEQQPKRGRKRE